MDKEMSMHIKLNLSNWHIRKDYRCKSSPSWGWFTNHF